MRGETRDFRKERRKNKAKPDSEKEEVQSLRGRRANKSSERPKFAQRNLGSNRKTSKKKKGGRKEKGGGKKGGLTWALAKKNRADRRWQR